MAAVCPLYEAIHTGEAPLLLAWLASPPFSRRSLRTAVLYLPRTFQRLQGDHKDLVVLIHKFLHPLAYGRRGKWDR